MDPDHVFFLQFANYILDPPLAKAGKPAEVGIAAAVNADLFGAILRFARLEHQAVDGILSGSEAIRNAVNRTGTGLTLDRRAGNAARGVILSGNGLRDRCSIFVCSKYCHRRTIFY
jgi:hypothetical protein